MLSVLHRYREATGHSHDSQLLRAVPKRKFLTIRDTEGPNDALRAVLFFAAWHSQTRGPTFVVGTPAELLAFWAGIHDVVEHLTCRKFLAFRDGSLAYAGKDSTWEVMGSLSTVPFGYGELGPLFRIPLDEKALWVFLNWTTAPASFLSQAPLGLVVPRQGKPAIL